jgi:hypothetical protein
VNMSRAAAVQAADDFRIKPAARHEREEAAGRLSCIELHAAAGGEDPAEPLRIGSQIQIFRQQVFGSQRQYGRGVPGGVRLATRLTVPSPPAATTALKLPVASRAAACWASSSMLDTTRPRKSASTRCCRNWSASACRSLPPACGLTEISTSRASTGI